MSWRVDSAAGAAIWDSEPLSPTDVACRDEELAWLMRRERRGWKVVNGRIADARSPVTGGPVPVGMPEGTYGGLLAYPPAQNLTAVTGAATILGWWESARYSPIPANGVLAPQAYRVAASGLITSSATAQTMTMNPGIGTTPANAAPTTRQDLGASGALSLGASSAQTNMLWYLVGDITVRTAGTAGTAYGLFELRITNVAGTTTNLLASLFGNTVATVDFTGATANYPGGLVIAGTPSATAVSVTPTQVHWMDWN